MPEGSNPLVAQAPQDGDGPGPLTSGNGDYGWAGGIGIAESAMDVFNGIKDGNWVEGGLGMLGLAAEGAAAAIDPFGWLMSSVASFLMEHVQPLKDMLDSVCGDPPVIQSYSETWSNVASSLQDTQVTFANAVKNGTTGWTGAAADAYRDSCKEQEETIGGAATVAGAISTVVMIMGEVVSFVRETVRDLIADLVGKLISWVMETVFSLGFGTPVVVAQAVTAISKWATKIADLLKKLLDTIRRVSPLLGKLADVFASIIKVCGKIAGKVTGLDVISTKNIVPGGFLHRGGADIPTPGGRGGGSGGGSGSGSGGSNGDGPGDGNGTGNGSGRGDGSAGADGSGGSPSSGGSDGTGDAGSSGTPSSGGSPGGTASPGPTRSGDGSPGSLGPGGTRADTPVGGAARPDSGSGTPTSGPPHPGGGPSHSGGPPQGGSGPSHAATPPSGPASHPGGAPSHPDSGPAHATAHGGGRPDGAPPSHHPGGGTPASSRVDTPGAGNPHSGGDSGPSPSPGPHHGGGPGPASDPASPRPGDTHQSSTTAASGSTPSSTLPRPDTPSAHMPSQRGPDHHSSAPPVQGQHPLGTGPSGAGHPGPGGGPAPSSPGSRPGTTGWTGTPGGPGAPTPRSPEMPPPRPGAPGPAGHAPGGHPGATRPGAYGPPGAMPHPLPRGFVPHGGPGPAGPPHRPLPPSPPTPPPGPPRPHGPGPAGPGHHAAPPHHGPARPAPQGSPRPPDAAPPTHRVETPHPAEPHRPDGQPHDTSRHDPAGDSSLDAHGADRPAPDEVNRHHAERTPSGTSFHRGDPDMGDLPHRVRPDPDGRYTVDVHVTPDGHARIGNHLYTPEEFADILRRNGDYDGRPVRLIGCDAGSNDFARRLARELDTEVLAPSKPAWTDARGRVFSSDYEIGPDGRVRPKIPPNGEWEVHRPDGSASRAGEDGFTPDTAGADKHDLAPDDARARGDENAVGHDDGAHPDPTDDPEYAPPPPPRVIDPDDPAFHERFVAWDRPPAHHVYDPPIQAPHRDREAVPDGNENPSSLRPNADPGKVPAPLRDLPGHQPLHPNTAYPVVNENGTRTTFYTDDTGTVKWVEAEPGAKSMKIKGKGDSSGFNPDLGYPLLPDVKYRVPNFHEPGSFFDLHTDHRGQTDSMTGDLHAKGQDGNRRDDSGHDGAQRRAQMEGEAAYPKPSDPATSGLTPEQIERSRVKWAGGHLVANEFGGFGEYLNMHPQMAASNSGNFRDGWVHDASWRAQEKELGAFAKEPHQDIHNYQVRMERGEDGVPSEVIMRWQEVTYERGPDGSVVLDENGDKKIQSVVTKERVFPNRPEEVNYGPDRRYKGR